MLSIASSSTWSWRGWVVEWGTEKGRERVGDAMRMRRQAEILITSSRAAN
jgi:hypothetical protein